MSETKSGQSGNRQTRQHRTPRREPLPLTPMAHTFTREEASRGGTRGSQVTRQRMHDRQLLSAQIRPLVEAIQQGEIGQRLLEVALRAAAKLDSGLDDMPVEESIDMYRLAQITETVFKMYRLETGQSTSNAAHATVNQEELDARTAVLRARLLPDESA